MYVSVIIFSYFSNICLAVHSIEENFVKLKIFIFFPRKLNETNSCGKCDFKSDVICAEVNIFPHNKADILQNIFIVTIPLYYSRVL